VSNNLAHKRREEFRVVTIGLCGIAAVLAAGMFVVERSETASDRAAICAKPPVTTQTSTSSPCP
jgi:hypothetical protein